MSVTSQNHAGTSTLIEPSSLLLTTASPPVAGRGSVNDEFRPTEPNGGRGVEFTEVVRTIGRNWVLILVTVLAASVIGWLVASTSAPTYTAESKVMLSAVTVTAAPQEQVQGNNLVIQQMGTYTALVSTPLVLQPTIDQL